MKNIAIEIKERINKFLEKDGKRLPSRGILTGQSVATMYLDIVGFNNYQNKTNTPLAINDVDVFVFAKKGSFKEKNMISKQNVKIDYINDYGRFLGAYAQNKYTIVATKHLKSLNVTFVTTNEKNLGALELISKFDINVTQIAIDLATDELITSKYFDEFVKSGQLRIVDMQTPHHTAIRLAKKANEFGFYVDYEREFAKLVIVETNCKYFSQKYYQNYLKHKEILDIYFELKTIVPNVDWATDDESDYEMDILYTLKCNTNVFDEYRKFHSCMGLYFSESILRTNNMFYGNNKDFREIFYDQFNGKSYREDVGYRSITYYFMEKFYHKGISEANFRPIFKMCKQHPALVPVYYSFDNYNTLVEFHNNLKKLVSIKGVSAIGIVESTRAEVPSTYEGLLELYKNEMGVLCANLIEPSIKDFKFYQWKFSEITTALELIEEGKRQKHCVGGYGSLIKHGTSKILSMKALNSLIVDYTLELRILDDNIFYIRQAMAKYNRPIDKKWINALAIAITKNSNIKVLTEAEHKEYIANKQETFSQSVQDGVYDDDEIPF